MGKKFMVDVNQLLNQLTYHRGFNFAVTKLIQKPKQPQRNAL